MTDKKKTKIDELRRDIINKMTLAGDPLPIDPDTGEIDTNRLTDAQRAAFVKAQQQLIKDYGQLPIDEIRKLVQALQPDPAIRELLDEIKDLEPYIKAELKKPEYRGKSFKKLMENTPIELLELRRDPNGYVYKVFEAAKAAKAEKEITALEPYRANKMLLPTDKMNLFVWNLKETHGQIEFDLSRAGSDDNATARFSLTFDDDPNIKITKEINHFDKRVMSAAGTAFNSGHPIISATGIYYAIGGTGKPGASTIERIDKALSKLDLAKVFIDNTIEANIYNYDTFRKEDRLLHFKRVTAMSNGKIADTFIQILEEPILIAFARQRKQISAVPMRVLQSPVSKTNNHLQIEDYLLWRIVQQKNEINKLKEQQQKKYTQNRQRQLREAGTLTILLRTFYERTGYNKKDTTAKKRARSTAEDFLTWYQSDAAGKWITSYTMDKERIIITLPIK